VAQPPHGALARQVRGDLPAAAWGVLRAAGTAQRRGPG